MEVFKWVEEIEKIYDELIEKAKSESLAEIQELRAQLEKETDKVVQETREHINLTLQNTSKEVVNENKNFEEKIKHLCEKIEKKFQLNKENLMKSIIKRLEFDF